MRNSLKKAAAALMSALVISVMTCVTAFADGNHIYDYNDMLTDSEIESIEEMLDEASEQTGFNICVVLNNEIEGSSYTYQDYADIFYEEEFGMNTDGVCLFVRFDPNYMHFSTSGKAIKTYDGRDEEIRNDIASELRSGDIVEAMDDFCGELVGIQTEYKSRWILYALMGLVIGLVVGVIAFFSIRRKYKRHAKTSSSVYVDKSGTNFKEKSDRFIRTYTSKTRISSNSGGGRSGGSHRSSSGGSHGGGGGRF